MLAQVLRYRSTALEFLGEERDLSAEAPTAESSAERAGARWALGQMPDMAEPRQVAEAASMQDEAAEMAPRSGADGLTATEAQALAAAEA